MTENLGTQPIETTKLALTDYSKHTVYIASPFFNDEQSKRVDRLKGLLNRLNLSFFSPKDSSNLLFEENKDNQTKVFEMNIEAIKNSTIVIAVTNDKDTGTLFEAGIAFTLGKPLFYLYDGGKSFNLMLSNSGVATTSFDELEVVITKLFRGTDYKELIAQQKSKYEVF